MKTSIMTITTEINDIPDIIQGSKLSSTIWFTGCKHNCKNCHNLNLQIKQSGFLLSNIYQELKNRRELTDWVVLSGGDPLYDINKSITNQIIKIAHQFNYKIFIYTGYKYDNIKKFIDSIKNDGYNIDYIKCGKYIEELKNDNYIFASINQKLYNDKGNCVYYYDNEKEEIINTLKN